MPDREAGDEAPTVGGSDHDELERETAAQTTIGTGSMLGLGCLVVVALFVLFALAYRWLGGTW